jgi:hypothetical protein
VRKHRNCAKRQKCIRAQESLYLVAATCFLPLSLFQQVVGAYWESVSVGNFQLCSCCRWLEDASGEPTADVHPLRRCAQNTAAAVNGWDSESFVSTRDDSAASDDDEAGLGPLPVRVAAGRSGCHRMSVGVTATSRIKLAYLSCRIGHLVPIW